MEQYYVLQRFPGYKKPFEFFKLKAKNVEKAWEEIEETISHNVSIEWLLTKEELKQLKKTLGGEL